MGKALLLFEKPKQAKTVCEKAFKSVNKKNHLLISPNEFFPEGAVAVWCIGHILRSKMPGDYKSEWKEWNLDQLPMIPDRFELEPEPSKKSQVSIIRKFVHDKEITEIYHFGDAGREGQLLVDEVLLFLNNKKPVKRVWSSSLTKASTHKALKEVKDNKHYYPLYSAAYTRQVTDWIIGMNASRTLSILMADKYNYNEKFQLGRCKTPLVGIVYNRELAIETFQSKPFWDVDIKFNANGIQFVGRWFKGAEEHIWEKEQSAALKQYCIDKEASIEKVTRKQVEVLPPQFYNLTELQSEANKRYGYSPTKTLEIAQELYEIGAISYPRADPRVVSSEEAQIFPLILEILSDLPKYNHLLPAPRTDLFLDKRYVNNELVDDHYAIIPTEEVKPPHTLSPEQNHIYDMIVESFIAAHYEPATYDHTEMVSSVDGHFTFKTKGKVLLEEGWRKVIPVIKSPNSEDEQSIPKLEENGKLKCESINVLESKTSPPKRFTQGQLVKIMETFCFLCF
jgi:DNA topoisomerase III